MSDLVRHVARMGGPRPVWEHYGEPVGHHGLPAAEIPPVGTIIELPEGQRYRVGRADRDSIANTVPMYPLDRHSARRVHR